MMATTFERTVVALRKLHTRFDDDARADQRAALRQLAAMPLRDTPALLGYHEALLFLCAHPADPAMLRQVEAEFRRIAAHLRARRGRHPTSLLGEGLPYVDAVTRYSHDGVRWLLGHADCRVAIESYAEPRLDLNEVLRLTLPSLERNETTAALTNDELLDALEVAPRRRLAFIVNELGRLDATPHVKDQLFDALDLWVRVSPRRRRFSRAYNRLPMRATFFQHERLRNFDAMALMNAALPRARGLGTEARAQATGVVKDALALTCRETDPGTYLDDRTLRIFDLERGLTAAIYGMTPERQLPLESYVGFTLFKNGLPVAYGGAWVLGARAAFGMNIFEPYRGGESGYMMCQVLRVYRQSFGVRFFEVDAHQFGLDNPDGIATGAFWFYHRHGFRPLDAALAALAERERAKIARRAGYRSDEATLLRLTGSNMALNFGGPAPAHLFDLTTRVTRLVQRVYGGDRVAAERDCVQRFGAQVRLPPRLSVAQRRVFVEVAFVGRALDIADAPRLDLLRRMVLVKPVDLFGYQALMLEFLAGPAAPQTSRSAGR